MNWSSVKRLAVLACATALCWNAAFAPAALATEEPATPSISETPSQGTLEGEQVGIENPGSTTDQGTSTDQPAVESYKETLSACTIGAGQLISFTTISPSYAGNPATEGYYPGDLTVEITGQIIIEAGGELSIGTLSLGGTERSPVITGTRTEAGLIVVKAGGTLRLNDVTFDTDGTGPLIIQEPGGSVELQMTQVEEGMVQWSSPLVDNLYVGPDDIWLEASTPLTPEMLPTTLEVDVQYRGESTTRQVSLSWDVEDYQGETQGQLVLTGTFLDEENAPLLSMLPLELTVHWYTPETIVVTQAVWKGDTVPSVQLTVEELPEWAEVWGEISQDNGTTWTRLDNEDSFFIVNGEPEGYVCVFVLPDDTPRLFRIAAEDTWEQRFWKSESFALSPEDTEDSGGNRGGSTTPDTPDREPQPTQQPSPSPSPQPEGTQPTESPQAGSEPPYQQPPQAGGLANLPETAAQTGDLNLPVQPEAPETEEEQTAEENAVQKTETAEEPVLEETATLAEEPAEKTAAVPGVQLLLGVAGVGVCVLAGLGAGKLLAKKKS